jgi:hypothetical protein
MDKKIVLYDGLSNRDVAHILADSSLKTSIDIVEHDTGRVIFKGLHNKVIVGGSGLIARKLFDIDTDEITPTYNTMLGIETPAGEETHEKEWGTNATEEEPKILLFCIGLDGCGNENSQVYPVDYTKCISPDSLIPFRYQLKNNDLSDDLRETYFGRVEVGNFAAYYFKRFDGQPTLVQQYIDGTLLDEGVYDSAKTTSAETYVEITLKVTKEDIRDYFVATVGIDEAKINSVSLCYAWPKEIDGTLYFNDIRPITRLNFPNEPMIDITKGIDIIYHVYM